MPLADPRASAVKSPARWRKVGVVAAVVLVHVALIGFVLSSLPQSFLALPSPHEIFYVFHPITKPARLPVKIEPPPAALHAIVKPPIFRYAPSPPGTALTPTPDSKGLGLSLFGCAPENLADLTPEQRAHCGQGLRPAELAGAIPGRFQMHALDAARWQQAIHDRNTPFAVPCTYTEQVIVNGVTGETAPAAMTDPLCVLGLKQPH